MLFSNELTYVVLDFACIFFICICWKLHYLFVLDCYAWYIYGTMDGRRAETGATLSANHVYPVGGVAHEARR